MNISYIKNNFKLSTLIILIVTAIPGLQKLIVLTFIGYLYNSEILSAFINDTFIVLIISYFTAYNWANILIADIHKFPKTHQVRLLIKISCYSFVYCVLSLSIILLLYYTGLIVDCLGCIVYIFCLTIYQIWRHYYITNHFYNDVLKFDCVIILSSIASAFIGSKYSTLLLIGQSIPFLIPVIYFYYEKEIKVKFSIKLFKGYFNKNLNIRAIQNGISSFSTTSIPLFMAPIAYQLLKSEYTSVIGYFTNVANIILLIPRSFALHNIPTLAKAYRDKLIFETLYENYKKNIFKIILVLFILSSSTLFIFYGVSRHFHFFDTYLRLPYIQVICLLILTTTLLSQILLPASNRAMISRQEIMLLKANLISLTIFIFVFTVIYNLIIGSILIILSYQILLALTCFIRLFLLNMENK